MQRLLKTVFNLRAKFRENFKGTLYNRCKHYFICDYLQEKNVKRKIKQRMIFSRYYTDVLI